MRALQNLKYLYMASAAAYIAQASVFWILPGTFIGSLGSSFILFAFALPMFLGISSSYQAVAGKKTRFSWYQKPAIIVAGLVCWLPNFLAFCTATVLMYQHIFHNNELGDAIWFLSINTFAAVFSLVAGGITLVVGDAYLTVRKKIKEHD